ncbi:MAG: CPBP family glutamic-type intramembrane protease [Candidatus Limnocylindrales bacterium]
MTGPDLPGPPRPGARTFTLEGRAAPGLFLVGWLAFLMGAGFLVVAFLSGVAEGVSFALALIGLALLSLGLVAGAGSQTIERAAHAPDGPPSAPVGPSPFLVFAASIPLSLLIIAILGVPLVALGMDTAGPLATLLSVAVQALVYLALIRLLVVGTGTLTWRAMGIGGRPVPALVEDVAWGVVIAVPVLLASALLAVLLSPILPTPDSPLPPSGSGGGLAANVLAAVVVAPLGEELFFRGFSTTIWARSMPVRAAVARAAVFFAIGHVLTVGGTDFGDATGRAVVAFVTRLPVALALGAIFVRRRSLAAPLALHATFNGLLLVLAQVATHG